LDDYKEQKFLKRHRGTAKTAEMAGQTKLKGIFSSREEPLISLGGGGTTDRTCRKENIGGGITLGLRHRKGRKKGGGGPWRCLLRRSGDVDEWDCARAAGERGQTKNYRRLDKGVARGSRGRSMGLWVRNQK